MVRDLENILFVFAWPTLLLASIIRGFVPPRIYWLWATVGNGLYCVTFLLLGLLATTSGQRVASIVMVVGFGATTAISYWMWRKHKDDDDDFGNKLARWAKNKILPKPKAVPVRQGL